MHRTGPANHRRTPRAGSRAQRHRPNNCACLPGFEPFPGAVFEVVLFETKTLSPDDRAQCVT
jgi:hypothetical protein